jgi:hypothetical protein
MHQLAWIRLMVARHPWTYWLVVVVLAGAVGLSAARAMAAVDATRRSWGQQQSVWTATVAIEPGQPVTAERVQVPLAVAPADAVLDVPRGVIARQRVSAGEIITDSDVSARGTAALVPDGWVAFVVPASVDQFAVGDHLNVYAVDQLVGAGLVVDVGESELMVAIPDASAPALSAALLADAVTLGLTSTP